MNNDTNSLFEDEDSHREQSQATSKQPLGRRFGAKRTISDLNLPGAILAVKESVHCNDLKQLQAALIAKLEQNSQQTRVRYARFVIRWFFSDGLNGIAQKTWLAYEDEKILSDILRYLYLANEPVMGACVSDCLFAIEVGMRVPASLFDRFLSSHYGGLQTKKTTQRLKSNLMRLGVLERCPGEDDRIANLTPSKTSLLILSHLIFAANEVRTIELQNLFANPFWKYLGFKHEDEVRAIFRQADGAGTIGKYVVADQLEQVTTCQSLSEFFSNKVRL